MALSCSLGGGGEVGSGGYWPMGTFGAVVAGKGQVRIAGFQKGGGVVGRGGQWRGVSRTVEIAWRICMGSGA